MFAPARHQTRLSDCSTPDTVKKDPNTTILSSGLALEFAFSKASEGDPCVETPACLTSGSSISSRTART